MRVAHYWVVHKITGEATNAGCYRSKAQTIIDSKADKENWGIVIKWVSI